MAVFKCKMCGGTIEFEPGATVGVCDSCGTKQTLPRLDDEKRANLYDRANHFRRNNEFDKATGIYEQILNEDTTDAEAYWSLVLCRYGIEYVEDPSSHQRIPTVNRVQFTSIFDDDNYKSALQYADGYQREIYEEEAKTINEIQKGILAISQKEEPFDVFICYKETDNNGRRTPDSVLANDLYHQLTQEGFKVFFARITLEDKLGTAYEPYIFAALNSAKVMVVLGTKPEYFNAVWVKNEWSRYLALIKNGAKKMLIPAYKDMDPYDLPEEFAHLQSQDMSKLGFMQDLIRGIKKISASEEVKTVVREVTQGGGNTNTESLIKRAFLFLEDSNWSSANEYFDKVLDVDPENAEAYLGKLMAELNIQERKGLADCEQPLDNNGNYQKAVRFGNDKLVSELKGYIAHIKERNEQNRLEGIYSSAVSNMKSANTEFDYQSIAKTFRSISGYRDADVLAQKCLEKAEISSKDATYDLAITQMSEKSIAGYQNAVRTFERIIDWKNSQEQIAICKRKIEEIKLAAKKRAKIAKIVSSAVVLCFVVVMVITKEIIPNSKYKGAMNLYAAGDYMAAYEVFAELDHYRDSSEKADESRYIYATNLLNEEKYEEAFAVFNELHDYEDSSEKAWSAIYHAQVASLTNVKTGQTIRFGLYPQHHYPYEKKEIEWVVLKTEGNKALVISKYALDQKPYHDTKTEITWDKSTLRKWLNEEFYLAAFSRAHQSLISDTEVINTVTGNSENYPTTAGETTIDKVFILSKDEITTYFPSESSRRWAALYSSSRSDAWLRGPGMYTNQNAICIDDDGEISSIGTSVNTFAFVRPAMWIEIGE